jgi:hypothetical protein
MNTRRQFLLTAPLGVLGASMLAPVALAGGDHAKVPTPPPGAPPAFGTAPMVGPEVTPSTFAEAEKLVQVTLTAAEREMAAASWRRTLASVYERRTGPRKLAIEPAIAPATQWNPVLPGRRPGRPRIVRSLGERRRSAARRRRRDRLRTGVALSQWIAARKLSSERLTAIYIARIAASIRACVR